VVTGGEPLLQREIGTLTRALHAARHHVTVETAGTVAPDFVCDLLSLSPKTANSDPSGPWQERHQRLRQRLDPARRLLARSSEHQVKLVVEDADDMPEQLALLESLGPVSPERVLLMAQGRTAAEVAARALVVAGVCLEHGFRYTRAAPDLRRTRGTRWASSASPRPSRSSTATGCASTRPSAALLTAIGCASRSSRVAASSTTTTWCATTRCSRRWWSTSSSGWTMRWR
jgi:hypothetical protein